MDDAPETTADDKADPPKNKKKREQVMAVMAVLGVVLTLILIRRSSTTSAANAASTGVDPNAYATQGNYAGAGTAGSASDFPDYSAQFTAIGNSLDTLSSAESANQQGLASIYQGLNGLPAAIAAAMPNQSTNNSAGGNSGTPVVVNIGGTSGSSQGASTPSSADAARAALAAQPSGLTGAARHQQEVSNRSLRAAAKGK